MSFLRFWLSALSESFGVGWVVFGIVSTVIPVAVSLLEKYWPWAASFTWVKWSAAHQNELHLAIALLVVLIYLGYAPYQLYKKRDADITATNSENADLKSRVEGLDKEVRRLEENNQLASFLKQQVGLSRQGSLQSRANILAEELLQFGEEKNAASTRRTYEMHDRVRLAVDKATADAIWQEDTQRLLTEMQEASRIFNQKYTARIVVLADEFRSRGFTDEKLERWVEHPHTAALQHTLIEIATALSKMAIQLDNQEKTSTPAPQ